MGIIRRGPHDSGHRGLRGKNQWEASISRQHKFLERVRCFGDTQQHVGGVLVEQRSLLEHMEAGPRKHQLLTPIVI